ncbi:MAG: hypothetical protein KF908_10485 [Nitrosomonas sp.]|uniref:hypothetical protein n=1 Tax=Nitrosomonas aestuarii TaxID=52441 RepID=UPI00147E8D8B|nr:hypothetical protein [Nitrosomonas aestuarii]MBX3630310.1 hypothetical protein [Nitrosomonas sp.]
MVPLIPSLQERLNRVRIIQERTAKRNKMLREGLWNTEEDETIEVNLLLSTEQS